MQQNRISADILMMNQAVDRLVRWPIEVMLKVS